MEKLSPIIFEEVSFDAPNGVSIINKISFVIEPHDFIILLGENGSGKSTIIKLLNKTYKPSKGRILSERKRISTLSQFVKDSLFLDLSILENANLIRQSYDKKIKSAIDKKELKDYLDLFNTSLSKDLNKKVSDLSGGEQQTLAFALYLKHTPDLLLLDEHTSALDPKIARHIMSLTADIIKKRQLTAVMTTHNLEFAELYGNRIFAIKEGSLIFESVKGEKPDRHKLLDLCY